MYCTKNWLQTIEIMTKIIGMMFYTERIKLVHLKYWCLHSFNYIFKIFNYKITTRFQGNTQTEYLFNTGRCDGDIMC